MNYEWNDLFSVIDSSQIPEINLYMDQLTTFMEEKLACYKRNNSDKIITKTMINNYTKDKILPAPVKRKYSPEQLMLLIIIFHLKPVLSINDIGCLLNSQQAKDMDVKEIYRLFTEIQNKQKETLDESAAPFSAAVKEMIGSNNLDNAGDIEILITALILAIDSSYKKYMAEKIIDDYLKKAQ
ncbi:DUF1836 domain-containing protein [Tyzzerella sp. OttesenSCG-928-J15]|nr:DUF1836 domain-containing protein [Tyzzerella sp. OttesenSCG-928-J15]